jgi:hypothetical protein
VDYVCINLDSGRAVRMPEIFARAYVATNPRETLIYRSSDA